MGSRTFDPGRISALSDGVFAIAMTLLVLDLQLPDAQPFSDPSAFARELASQFPGFASWLLSFAVLCRLWTVHHDLLADGDTRSRGFTTWNFVFLGAVSFIPFPTSLLAEHPEELLSVVVFSATYVVAGIALGRMWRLLDAPAAADRAVPLPRRVSHAMLVILGTAFLSCILALVEPRLGAALWFSYPVTGGIVRRRDRRRSARTTSTGVEADGSYRPDTEKSE
jgi:uncharacterized membrane protein